MQLCKATRADLVLSKVLNFLRSGWPSNIPDPVKPYFSRRDELSIEEGCVLWEMRVIVPKKLQSEVLNMLHKGHVGMVKMKMIAPKLHMVAGYRQDDRTVGQVVQIMPRSSESS